jgi:type VI secretion system secreted protein VgrG
MGELMTPTQATHRISISTPLGQDALLLRGFSGSEAISQLFHFDLDLLSVNDSVAPQSLIGKPVTIRVSTLEGGQRHWNGMISRFSQGPQEKRLTAYRAQMVPWLWFLTRTSNCRIFQNLKVPDIIQQVFTDLGYHDFELHLYDSYPSRDYCVQYRETDFNFVSRLMEEEGISYFFEHEDGKHTLVLTDDPAGHQPCPGQETAHYSFYGSGASYQEDLVTEWHYQEEFRTGKWSQRDYNFETPSNNLEVTVNGQNAFEIYEYPGEYSIFSDGDRLARIRLEEQTTPSVVSHGASMCRNFRSGFEFTLQGHYRDALNQKYLITALRHTATQAGSYEVGAAGNEVTYHNSFECIPASTKFRPPRVTPQPFVQGCQTALVVGPAGEEIYTDNYGRVKVQFYWDREGKKDEKSSCWVRVSHPWAGQGWGSLAIPRIGQEVVVDFLEGNPDQPIITGRVYNAEQTPPFGLPGGAVVSGVKSNSTKGGGGYNEISLNDTKGAELINIHAQYDQQKKVGHDERVNIGNNRTEQVGNDETITIGNNRTEKVGNNENITIGSNRTESVGSNESITVGSNRTESVGSNETISIGSNRTETVGSSETVTIALTRTHTVGVNDALTVGAAQEVTVGAAQAITVGAARIITVGDSQTVTVSSNLTESVGSDRTETVGGNQTTTISSNLTESIGADQAVQIGGKLEEQVAADHTNSVGGKRTMQISSDDSLNVGANLSVIAADKITLQVGQSKLTMSSDGTIELDGMNITIKGSTAIKAQAVQINIEASGINTIKGSVVKIN